MKHEHQWSGAVSTSWTVRCSSETNAFEPYVVFLPGDVKYCLVEGCTGLSVNVLGLNGCSGFFVKVPDKQNVYTEEMPVDASDAVEPAPVAPFQPTAQEFAAESDDASDGEEDEDVS